jgi:hypothetical protein
MKHVKQVWQRHQKQIMYPGVKFISAETLADAGPYKFGSKLSEISFLKKNYTINSEFYQNNCCGHFISSIVNINNGVMRYIGHNQKNGGLKALTNEVLDTGKKGIIHDGVLIEDTFAEAFDAWIASILITASKRDLAETAAVSAIGYGTSIIGCGAEAGIADYVIPQMSPDGRPGVTILLVHPDKKQLKEQVIDR